MQYPRNAIGQGPSPATRAESLFTTLSEFDPEFQRLAKLVQHIGAIADHIEGGRPQEAASPNGAQIDNCMMSSARRRLETLRMLCAQLETETERVSRTVGGISSTKFTDVQNRL